MAGERPDPGASSHPMRRFRGAEAQVQHHLVPTHGLGKELQGLLFDAVLQRLLDRDVCCWLQLTRRDTFSAEEMADPFIAESACHAVSASPTRSQFSRRMGMIAAQASRGSAPFLLVVIQPSSAVSRVESQGWEDMRQPCRQVVRDHPVVPSLQVAQHQLFSGTMQDRKCARIVSMLR